LAETEIREIHSLCFFDGSADTFGAAGGAAAGFTGLQLADAWSQFYETILAESYGFK
jgi:hypothetical protein